MVTIDGVGIITPSDTRVVPFDIEKEERAASGKLRVDTVATKRRLQFGWSLIKHEDIKCILDLLAAKKFHTIVYPDPQGGEAHTITAKVDGNVQISSWRRIGGVRYWRDVSISLIEQ